MYKRSYNQIKSELKSRFKTIEFSVVLNGNYAADDADWNYKDVPHLNIVHSQVDSLQAWIDHGAIATINFQKVMSITLPMVVFNYDANKLDQVYFTSFGPILLLINTVTVGNDNSCEVTTRYSLFAKSPFHWAFPLLKRLIIRNNRILMSEDTPMRDRRGVLRRNDHTFFKKTETYGYEFTTELSRNNVRLNRDKKNVIVSLESLTNTNLNLIGDKVGVLSFKVIKGKNGLTIWPTTCPHEGAELNIEKECDNNGYVSCPWHGRRIAPLCVIKNGVLTSINRALPYEVDLDSTSIKITFVGGS